jgi:hypothetical protein
VAGEGLDVVIADAEAAGQSARDGVDDGIGQKIIPGGAERVQEGDGIGLDQGGVEGGMPRPVLAEGGEGGERGGLATAWKDVSSN